MSYWSSSTHDLLVSQPSYIGTLYANNWRIFANDLGPMDGNLDIWEQLLSAAMAAITAWDLKAYGPEPTTGVDLDTLLASPTLACDDYVRLAWYFIKLMPDYTAGLRVTAVGWDGGAVGNHAQMLVSYSGMSLLLDPTTGLVVKYSGKTEDVLNSLCSGGCVSPLLRASFEAYNNYSIGSFNTMVCAAVLNGRYRPSDLYYYTSDLDEFNNISGPRCLTPQGDLARISRAA